MAKKSNLRDLQEIRQAIFPKDRIAFCKQAVIADQASLNAWADTLKEWRINPKTHPFYDPDEAMKDLRREIAEHNFLDQYFEDGMIPEDMMLSELRHIGYLKDECRE